MFKHLKFYSGHQKIFFWSDLHYNHNPSDGTGWLHTSRGFKTLEEHDEAIISNCNHVSDNESILFLLGDTCLGNNSKENILKLFKELNYTELYIMPGNHFAGLHQQFEKSNQSFDRFMRCIIYSENRKIVYLIPNYYEISVDRQAIVLSHYPMASWNGMGSGSIMIHGHVHGHLKDSIVGKELYKGKMIDAGVESCKYPISFCNLKDTMDSRPIIKTDHHNPLTQNPF